MKSTMEILEKVFITKKCTQFKTSHTLEDDFWISREFKCWKIVFKIWTVFFWIKLISVLIHLRYLYYNTSSLELSCLPCHLCRTSPWRNETPLQRSPYQVLHQCPYLFIHSSTTRHNNWICQTICQDKPINFIIKLINFIIKLYTYHNTLFVKHSIH